MKKILIDARLYGTKHTGIGRYTKNLLVALSKLKTNYEITILAHIDAKKEIEKDLKNKFKIVYTNISHYSLAEQLYLRSTIYDLRPDLTHFTHFNKPILYKGLSVITIHDLIKHHFKGKNTTTKNPILYWPKYFAYRFMTNFNIKNNFIIVPSQYWKNYILTHFHKKQSQICVTHEAVDPAFLSTIYNLRSTIPKDYLLYTGNLYPHKNIIVLIEALKQLPDLKLKIICGRDHFQKLFEQKYKNNPQLEFLGYIPDKDFKKIYSQALCLVHPSLMEGFSLTGLESMALGCPVIAANASCLPEIYGQAALFFNPYDPTDLVDKIKILQKHPDIRRSLIKKGLEQVKKYSWSKTAQNTLDFYEKILS